MESTNTLEEELVLELLKQVQREFNSVNEIVRLTKELSEASSRDDRVTMQMVLEMRKSEMDIVDGCKKSVAILLENAPLDMQSRFQPALKGEASEQEDIKGINQIAAIIHSSKAAIEQAIVVDKVMSTRLAGEESYYAGN